MNLDIVADVDKHIESFHFLIFIYHFLNSVWSLMLQIEYTRLRL
jgi:hypothetical protein